MTLTCSTCGKKFERRKTLVKEGQRFFFCGQECRYKYLPLAPPNLAKFKKIKLTCANCGKEFERSPGSIKPGQTKFFCGTLCSAKYLQANYRTGKLVQ